MKNKFIQSTVLIAGVFAATTLSLSAAVIYPKSQTRTVQAFLDISGTPNVQRAAASGFTTFSNSVGFAGGGRFEPYYVQALQNSQIGDAAITAQGLASVGLGNGLVGNGGAAADFQVKFRLLQPVSATLAGQLVWNEISTLVPESPVVKLSGAQGVIFQTDLASPDGTPLDYTTNVNLSPGDYTLEGHASVTNDFCCGADRSFTLDFNATPTGPPIAGAGNVYQVTGALNGQMLTGNRINSVSILPRDFVSFALDSRSDNTQPDKLMALVSDGLDHSLRLAVWDLKSASIIAELGPVEVESSLLTQGEFAAIANWYPLSQGRILQQTDAATSHLTLATRGTFNATSTVNNLMASSIIGQFSVINRGGAATNTVLIRNGNLQTGRRLGTTP